MARDGRHLLLPAPKSEEPTLTMGTPLPMEFRTPIIGGSARCLILEALGGMHDN